MRLTHETEVSLLATYHAIEVNHCATSCMPPLSILGFLCSALDSKNFKLFKLLLSLMSVPFGLTVNGILWFAGKPFIFNLHVRHLRESLILSFSASLLPSPAYKQDNYTYCT